ncbi:MAG: aminotransferase class V-fold PLP-dependent enzyme [Planctomycetota bacterium]
MPPIYLDFNRTAPMAPSVLAAMEPYWITHAMLPSQQHPAAKAIAEALESSRERVATLMGCEPFEVIFTSGGTESNNLAILGRPDIASCESNSGQHILVDPACSSAISPVMSQLAQQGFEVELLPCNADGVIESDAIRSSIRSTTCLCCIAVASGITGVIQPVHEIASQCRDAGVSVHLDAVDAAGKLELIARSLPVDTMSISGHKLYGPKGSGALYVRRGTRLQSLMQGELREMGLRPGSENVPAWIGLGVAAMLASHAGNELHGMMDEHIRNLVVGLQAALPSSQRETIRWIGEDSPRMPGTAVLDIGMNAGRIQQLCDDLVFSTSDSCDPPDEMARALFATGMTQESIPRCMRISTGWTTSSDQIDAAVVSLASAIERCI